MARVMPRPRRWWPIVVGAVVLLTVAVVSFMSVFYVDLLWFREVNFSGVFWTTFSAKVLLGAIFGLIFFVLLYINLLIVQRVAPRYRVLTPEQEVIERYRLALEPYLKWIIPALCLLVAVGVGVGVTGEWRSFLLWRNSSGIAFGNPDPLFHRDPAFYIFDLPFLKFVQGWLFSSLVGITVITAAAHYLWGGIRPQAVGEKVTPQVKAHLSVLLGLIVLAKAWGFYLGRFDLLTSPRGVVTGAGYTDIHAQLPALNLLLIVAIVCAGLFFVNIRFRGWGMPVIGIALLALVSVVAGGIFPTFVQKVRVDPQELQQERPYIARNIQFTRQAFGLDSIQSTSPPVEPDVTAQTLVDSAMTVANIRLWDPKLLQLNYQQLQRIKQYYEFEDVDVDRYVLDGQERVVMASAREVSQNGISSGGATWQNTHLVYTHGYGMVASQVNGSTPQGSPLFILQDIPPTGSAQAGSQDLAASLNAGQPRVYYGERNDVPYVVVNSGAKELDYQGTATNDNEQVTYEYKGKGGIPIGGFFNKLLFAWRFQDVNLLISSLIHDDSRVMMYRSILDRVPKVAPFLKFDADPYAAVVDGRIVWIWDAYTTSNAYPYSEEVNLADVTGGDLAGSANYIRNSVKVVVDAYEGSMKYYVSDPTDPVIQVWQKIFPDMFVPQSDAPQELQAHFRYPENLFQVQAHQFVNYHVTDPSVFYGKQDFWSVPTDPAAAANSGGAPSSDMRPYYVLLTPPGTGTPQFSLILPLTPQNRQNMVAWLAAGSDPANYGKIVSYEFPAGGNVDGPVQVFNQIQSYPPFSEQQTLLSTGDSRVQYGNLLVIPFENSFLYVQPVFVQSTQANAFPELKRVVVVHGGTVGIGATLAEALLDSGLGGGQGQEGQGPAQQPVGTTIVDSLLAQALDHFKKADAALKAGDLATYQAEIQKARDLIGQAVAASIKKEGASGAVVPSSEPSPSPVPSPSATP